MNLFLSLSQLLLLNDDILKLNFKFRGPFICALLIKLNYNKSMFFVKQE